MILVTGAGFIGKSVAKSFGDSGILLSRNKSFDNEITFDLTETNNISNLIKTLNLKNVTQIVHTAGVTPWSKATDYSLDQKMSKTIVELCNKLQIRSLLFVSGWNVYDMSCKPPYSEDTPVGPIEPYGRSKLFSERYFMENLTCTHVTNLRVASVYGPGQRSSGLIPNLVSEAMAGRNLYLNDNEVRRDYLYIEDFVDALVKILRDDILEYNVINIGSGSSYSIDKIAHVIQDIFNKHYGIKPDVIYKKASNHDSIKNNQLSITRAKSLNILEDLTPISEGIRKYIKWRVDENIL